MHLIPAMNVSMKQRETHKPLPCKKRSLTPTEALFHRDLILKSATDGLSSPFDSNSVFIPVWITKSFRMQTFICIKNFYTKISLFQKGFLVRKREKANFDRFKEFKTVCFYFRNKIRAARPTNC